MITAIQFTERTDRPPKDDDLERCNCPDAGYIGHWFCGWCPQCNLPVFECGHSISTKTYARNWHDNVR